MLTPKPPMRPARNIKESERNLVDWMLFNRTDAARALFARHAAELKAAFEAWRESQE